MSVSGNIIGMPPGAGSSFPFAGTRPKTRKSLTVTSGSTTWVAPPNVYHVILQMVGGGGSGAVTQHSFGSNTLYATGGGSGVAIAPSVIQVNPGSVYVLTAGRGGEIKINSCSTNGVNGDGGTPSLFYGDTLYIAAPGGGGGRITTNGGPGGKVSFVSSILGMTGIDGIAAPTITSTGTPTTSSGVEYVPGASGSIGIVTDDTVSITLTHVIGPGAASLYGTGSIGRFTGSVSISLAGYGAGGGGAASRCSSDGSYSYSGVIGNGTGSAGGPGFVRIIWEE